MTVIRFVPALLLAIGAVSLILALLSVMDYDARVVVVVIGCVAIIAAVIAEIWWDAWD